MADLVTLALAKKYTNDTAEQFGAVKGANCQFSATETTGGHLNTFTWKNDNDETQTTSYTVKDGDDGLGIKGVAVNSSNHLIVTMDDDTTKDAGEISGGGGGTTVVANPILSGNEDEITSIQIGAEKFVVPTTNPTALTPSQITLLENVLLDCVYADASGAQKVNALIESLRGGVQKTLSSISATKTKTSYYTDETLSTADIVVTATYSDSSTSNVTANAVFDTSNVDVSTAGTYSIGVSYTENELTKTTTIQITSSERPAVKTLTSISATKTKTAYTVGDTLSTSDIVVTASYSDDTSADVTSNATLDTSNVNMAVAGTYAIGVVYTEDGVTKTTNISVVVEQSSETVIYTKSTLSATTNGADTKFGDNITSTSGKIYKYTFDYEITTGGNINLRSECPGQIQLVNGQKSTGDTGHVSKDITATQSRTRQPFILRYDSEDGDYGVKLTNITITERSAT